MNELFIKASRKKIRFSSTKGLLSIEDLWDIPLTMLDKVTVSLKKELDESAEMSFISKKSKATDDLELGFEVAKYVIETRLEEAEKARLAAENKAKREKILAIIEQKENEGLANADIADLRKMLDDLQG